MQTGKEGQTPRYPTPQELWNLTFPTVNAWGTESMLPDNDLATILRVPLLYIRPRKLFWHYERGSRARLNSLPAQGLISSVLLVQWFKVFGTYRKIARARAH
jgi:hypothetical protein